MKKIRIYTTSFCGFCVAAKRLFDKLELPYEEIGLDGKDELRMQLSSENQGWRTVPMIFIGEKFVGGYQEVAKLHSEKQLLPLVQDSDS